MLREVVYFRQDDLLLSFLPMAHVTERVLGFYTRLKAGLPAAYASSIGSVLQELPEVRRDHFRLGAAHFRKKLYPASRARWRSRRSRARRSSTGPTGYPAKG